MWGRRIEGVKIHNRPSRTKPSIGKYIYIYICITGKPRRRFSSPCPHRSCLSVVHTAVSTVKRQLNKKGSTHAHPRSMRPVPLRPAQIEGPIHREIPLNIFAPKSPPSRPKGYQVTREVAVIKTGLLFIDIL